MMRQMQQASATIAHAPTNILDSSPARQPSDSAVSSPHGLMTWRGQAEGAPAVGTVPVLTACVKAAWPPSHAPLGRQREEVRSVLRSQDKSQSSQWKIRSQVTE